MTCRSSLARGASGFESATGRRSVGTSSSSLRQSLTPRSGCHDRALVHVVGSFSKSIRWWSPVLSARAGVHGQRCPSTSATCCLDAHPQASRRDALKSYDPGHGRRAIPRPPRVARDTGLGKKSRSCEAGDGPVSADIVEVRRRGRQPAPWMPKLVVVNSKKPPKEVFHKVLDENETWDQFERRFEVIHLKTKNEAKLLTLSNINRTNIVLSRYYY